MALTLDGTAGITANPGTVTVTSGTFTTSTPAVNTTQTWNAGGVTFTGWKMNITDTASASGSLLADLQVGGSSKFSVRKDGAALASDGTVGSPGITFASDTDTGLYRIGANNIGIGVNGAKVLDIATTGLSVTGAIDTTSNLLVGTTNSSSTVGVGFKALPNATYPQLAMVGSATTNSATTLEIYSTGASAYRFYVGYGGTIFATSTTISAISDARYKENIVDLDVGLDAIMSLKPRKFDWKDGKGKNIKGDRGFIAQEFEQVFPDLIDEWKDNVADGEEPYKSVRQDLIPILVKAIQELSQRLSMLENK